MDLTHDDAAHVESVTTHEPDRAYRLRDDEPIDDGVRRIARGQLLEAQQEIAAVPPADAGEAVHATRKHLKRLRALVRLAREPLGETTYDEENTIFRDAGRQLAAARDARVRLDTLDALTRHMKSKKLPARVTAPLHLALRQDLKAEVDRDSGGAELATTHSALEQGFARTRDWPLAADDFAALTPGLQRIYRRGRKRMRATQADPSPEHLHAWRKRVKDLWYVAQLTRAADPKRLKKTARRAHALADLLGDAHDLHVLRDYVAAHPHCFENANDQRTLVAGIDRRAEKLCAKALASGEKLYQRKPKRFARRIERRWRKRTAAAG